MTLTVAGGLANEPLSAARDSLRRATRTAHARLNQHSLLIGITRPGYSLDDYQRVLVAYFHFYRVIEASIDDALSRLGLAFDYRVRRKLPWLVADLAHFGIDPETPSASPAWLPRGPENLDVGGLFGVLYTIEGSALGGRIIYRYLSTHLGVTADAGARFFFGYGDVVNDLWQQFNAEMERQLAEPGVRLRAGVTAGETFALMEQVLDDYAGNWRDFR
jgi:heme oxygenase (biliverdin-IX-beta and delta-forming)